MRTAAALVRRHPETVRRWIWSGRLAAVRRGTRLMIARGDLDAVAEAEGKRVTLAAWADRARSHAGSGRRASSAADLVLESRAERAADALTDAGR